MSAAVAWFRARSLREQRLIALMLAIALPMLLWLLVVLPVEAALADARDAHAGAVERHGRVLARVAAIEAARSGTDRGAAQRSSASMELLLAESASRAGLALEANSAEGPNAASIRIQPAPPGAALGWVVGLEANGITVDELNVTPAAPGLVALSARLSRSPA